MKICAITILTLAMLWPSSTMRSSEIPIGPFEYSGNGSITVFNTHSGEFETINYRNEDNSYGAKELDRINYMFRCRLTNEPAQMSIKLIEALDFIEDRLGAGHINIVSGYRSPTLNASLRRISHRVAEYSLHLKGMAADITIPNVKLSLIRDIAKKMHAGGVGYYPGRFVHVDVGDVRAW